MRYNFLACADTERLDKLPRMCRLHQRVLLTVAVAILASFPLAAEPEKPSTEPARSAYASAAALQNREAWDLASEEWTSLIELFPNDPLAAKARYYLGICELKLNKIDRARAAFAAAIKAGGDETTLGDARWELGRSTFLEAESGKRELYAAAATALEDFIAKHPQHRHISDALYFDGESLWQSDKKEKAIEVWSGMIQKSPQASRLPDALYSLGVGLAELKKPKEASAALSRHAREFPEHRLAFDVAMWRADLAVEAGLPADALKLLEPLLKIEPERRADVLLRLGQARFAAGQHALAAEAFEQVARDYSGSQFASQAAMSAATSQLEAKQPEKARPWLEGLIKTEGPHQLDAAHLLSTLELDAGAPAKAIAAIDAVMPKAKGLPIEPRLMIDRADAIWEIPDRRAEALVAYESFLTAYPLSPLLPQALSMAALGQLEMKKPELAIERADTFLKQFASDKLAVDVGRIRAEAFFAKGDFQGAVTAYASLSAAHPAAPQRSTWMLRQAAALVTFKQWKEAHEVLVQAIPGLTGDDVGEAMLLDASSLLELGKPKEAALLAEAIVTKMPAWSRADESLLLAIRASRQAGDDAAAMVLAERMVATRPDGPRADTAWYRVGELRQKAGKLDAAIEAFARSQKAKPNGPRVPWALLATGWAQDTAGRPADAIKAWSELIDSYSTSEAMAEALRARGDARQRTGDFKGGLLDARKALELPMEDQSKLETRFLESLCLIGDGQSQVAVPLLEKLVLDGQNFAALDRVLSELAWAQKAIGKTAEAAATRKQLLERFPKSSRAAEAWFETGEAAWEEKSWDTAAAAYTAAIASPDSAAIANQARHKFAWTSVMKKDYAAAAKGFQSQLTAAPKGPLAADARCMLGESLFKTGAYAPAEVAFREAIAEEKQLSSDDLRALSLVRSSECAAQQQRWDESLVAAEQLISRFPMSTYAPLARYASAWANQNLGKLDQSLVAYRALADSGRTALAARSRLMEGEILFEQGKHREAVKTFFKVAYGFGERAAPAEYHPWQAQATFESARCFEVLEKQDQARLLYQELIDRYPQSQQVSAAKKRLDILGKPKTTSPPRAK